jgi:hypothetical protein
VEAFIAAHKLERAPIKGTEQYYRFVDPDSGPMIGVFEPTGNATAAMLAKAFGEVPPAPPSDHLFVGCNYTVASQTEFLDAARSQMPLRRIPPRAWARLSNRIAHNDRHGPDN